MSVTDLGTISKEKLHMRHSPPASMLFREVRIIDPMSGIDSTADLLISNGSIERIADKGTIDAGKGTERIASEGKCLLPAFVDPHVHLRTPGREDAEDIDTGTRAAAAGGYCAVLAIPNTDPVVDNVSVLTSLMDRAKLEARIPVGFMAAITKGQLGKELAEMAELSAAGAVGFTDDGAPIIDSNVLRMALQYQKLCGRVLALHEEDPALSRAGVMSEGSVSAALGLAGIPDVSESVFIQRDASLAEHEGGRCHMMHLSSALSVDAVSAAKERGVGVTAEVTPHHLTLTDREVLSLDTRFKMNPPLRSEDDRKALIEGLRSGVIDCIATDHAPHAAEEKELPFELASMGVTGLETAFSALYTELVLPGIIGLDLLVERLSAAADIFDLERPKLETGNCANLCLVDLDREWEVGEPGYESRSANSCFFGRKLKGKVLMTVANGREAYRERSFAIREASNES